MTDPFAADERNESSTSKMVDGIQSASQHINDVIVTSRQPGMPLDILARAVREAPLAALAIAFLVGVTFSRGRR